MNVDRSVQQPADVIDVVGIVRLHPNNDHEPRNDNDNENDDDDVPVLEFLAKARQDHHHDNLLIDSQPADMLFDDSLWCRNSVLFPGYDGKRDYNTYKYHEHEAEAMEKETTTSSATCMTTSDSTHNDGSNTTGRNVCDSDVAYISMYPARKDIDCVYIPSCDEVFHAYDASNAGMALRLRQLFQVEEGLRRYDCDGRNQSMILHQEQMRLLTQRRMHQSDMQRDVPARDLDGPVDMDECNDDDSLHEPYDPHRTSTWHGSPTDPNVLAHNTLQLDSASTWNAPSRSPPTLIPVRDGQGRNQQSSSSSTFVISSASSFTPYHSTPPLLHNHLMVDNTITSSYRGQGDKKKGKVGKDEKGINSGCLPPLMTAEYITGKSMFSAKRNGGSSSTDSDSPNNSNSNNNVTASSTDPHMQLPGAYNIAKFSYEALEPFLSSSSSESDSDGCKPSADESEEEVLAADQSTGIDVDSSSLSCTQFTEAQSLVPPPALTFNSVPEEEEEDKAHHPVNTKHQRQHQHLQQQLQQPYEQHPRQSMMMEHRPQLPPSLTQRPTVANQQASSMMMIERKPQQIPQLQKQRMMMIDKQQNQPPTQLQQRMMIEQSLEQGLAAAKIHNAQILPRPQMETSRLGSLRDDGRIVQRQPPATKRHADLTNHHHDDSYVALPHSRQQQQVYAQQQQQQMYAQQQQQRQQQAYTQQQPQRYAQQEQHYAQQQQQKQQLLAMKKIRNATPLRSRMQSRGSMSSFKSSNSGGGDSNSSTVTPRQQQVMASRATSTSTTPSSASLSMLQIEISPGVFLHVHGSAQTEQAMKDGNMVPCQCFACDLALVCINIAECVICPVCRMLSPVDCGSRSNVGCGGAGLGITEANYLSWQEEAYIRQVPQQQSQHGIRARRRSRF